MSPFILHSIESYDLRSISPLHETFQQERIHLNSRAPEIITIILTCMSCINSLLDRVMKCAMNNCSPWIHEIYQGIFEICTDLGILVVNAKYAQKYTVAYTRFFAQCWRGEACDNVKQGGPGRAPLNLHLRDPSSETEQEREDVPNATPESEDSSESRARVQQPSPTSRPNLPRVLRWNPDADANARHTEVSQGRI